LDRLSDVFSRELPPDGCACVICEHSDETHRGLGWGEVLERVSGSPRLDVPTWPPFDLASLGSKAAEELADQPARPESPVNMDPDIAEEFREHYLRQTKRVRAAVDKWMSSCDETGSSVGAGPTPQDVDDETLTFAILTNLEAEDRSFFMALLSGTKELQPVMRAPTPGMLRRAARNETLVRMGLALQRLYRLPQPPRDAETAVYLVRNGKGPVGGKVHDLLHTISDINASEWEILTSGRFDGFLWSGAEDDGGLDGINSPAGDRLSIASRGQTPASGMYANYPSPGFGGFSPRVMSPGAGGIPPMGGLGRAPSTRNTTPFSRGPTPASFVSGTSMAQQQRAAVSHDEETEIAVVAELEREIFNGMEALEDAFEKLHERAIVVRDALRRRGAALAMSLQQRRGFGYKGIDVLPLSGSSGAHDRPAWADEESLMDGEAGGYSGLPPGLPVDAESFFGNWADDISELAPDDSASQVCSSNRMRRPKRRRERATPAPIEEEEEGEVAVDSKGRR